MKMGMFMNRVIGDMSGAVASIMCTLGDRLGLFKIMASAGSLTSDELAARAGISERYAREWLSALSSAGYLEYDPASLRFTLPPEYAPALAQEGGPVFMGGVYQHLPGLFGALDRLADAFRLGSGVAQDTYGEDFRAGMERISASWFDNLLVQQWLPEVPDTLSKLERGASVADIGCGSGRAVIKLAQAFPNSRFVGFDLFEPAIERATANAAAAGVADRVRFVRCDAARELPGQYDLITAFDVLHDISNPLAVLRNISWSLLPGGTRLAVGNKVLGQARRECRADRHGLVRHERPVLHADLVGQRR